jgi:hypothetical protein
MSILDFLDRRRLRGLILAIALAGSAVAAGDTPPTLAPATNTMLLVSLDDGSVIQQIIHVDADICFKSSRDSSTSCLRRGQPIVASNGTVIGFEMQKTQIQLVAGQ